MSKKENPDKEPRMTEDELIHVQPYDGEVRLPLRVYHDMVSSATKYENKIQAFEDAKLAIKRFMTFLRTKESISFEQAMTDFNKENPDLTMYVEDDGKVGFNLNLTS